MFNKPKSIDEEAAQHRQRNREIALDNSWWMERFVYEGHYYWPYKQLSYETFHTTLFNYWWKHHQLQLGPFVIEWKTRRSKMLTHQ